MEAFMEYCACCLCCGCYPARRYRGDLYEPLLLDNEREAVNRLLRFLEQKEEKPHLTDERLHALCTLSYSDNVELQRSAALCFSEISSRMLAPVSVNMMEPLVALLESEDTQVQRHATLAVNNFTLHGPESNIRTTLQSGALHPLLTLLNSPDTEVQCNACGCITSLATNAKAKREIVVKRGSRPLLRLAADAVDPRVQRNAVGALLNLTHLESNRSDLAREGAIKVFNDLLLDDDTEIQYYCAAALKSNRSDLAREGAIKVFNDLLLDDDTEIQYYCAAALSNMAVDQEHRRIMGSLWERNIPGRLIALLSSMSDKVRCQACLALRNLASDETNQRLIVRQGALPKLYHLLKTGSRDTQVAAAACVRNLSICKANQAELLQDWFLAILPRMLSDKSTAVRCHAAGTVRNLVDTENAEAFVQAGILDALTGNLVDSASSVELQSEVTAAVAIMANRESVRDHLHHTREGIVFPNLVSVATNCENLNVQYNCASIIGQLLVTGIEAETIEPNVPGLLCYLERLLNSGDANSIQISLWSLLLLAKYDNFQRVYPSSALPQKVQGLLRASLPANIQEMARSVVNKYTPS
ncbi:vacuolar protein 8-like [Branchiostoma floridae]|uniref:Vacuolar protein 8 n=1 Tax=Branchiostoma floridae TaxID=7739 RepID=A0A9J7KHJ1_BRAFL|nr:vacuolar protein 8-like [Branchiostoma floridae]